MKTSHAGFSMPEVLVASFILVWVVLSSLQLTSSSILGMGKSKQRNTVDAEIASRIERLRQEAFAYLCKQGCSDNELTKELIYNLDALKPLCHSSRLGKAFLESLNSEQQQLISNFTVNTTPAVPVAVDPKPDGNRLKINFEAKDLNINVNTTLVPHAQGWCP